MTEQLGLFPPSPFSPNLPGPLEQLSPLYQPGIVPPQPGTADYRQLQLWIEQQDSMASANAQVQWAAYQASRGGTQQAGVAADPLEAVRQHLLLQNP